MKKSIVTRLGSLAAAFAVTFAVFQSVALIGHPAPESGPLLVAARPAV